MIKYCILRTSLETLKNVKEDYPICQNDVLLNSVNCWYLPLNVIFTDSLLQRYKLAIELRTNDSFYLSLFGIWDELSLGMNCRLGRIVAWDELSLGTNCRLGRIVAWDELLLGTNCRLGRIVAWDELSLGTNCRSGRIVAFGNLGRTVVWDESLLATNRHFTLNKPMSRYNMGQSMTYRYKENRTAY